MDERQSAGESTADMMQALTQYLPGLVGATNPLIAPTAQAQAAADTSVAPLYAQGQLDLLKQFGPDMSRIGSEISRADQLAASETEKQIAQGPGRDLVTSAADLQALLDPEWNATKAAVGKGLGDYLNALGDPNSMTPSEREEVSRGVASQGFKNPNSATDALASAEKFGSALKAKQDRFGNAMTMVAGALPNLRSGYSGFEVATKRALTPNVGQAQMTTIPMNTGNNVWNSQNALMGNISQFQNTRLGNQRSTLDQVGQGVNIGGSLIGSIGGALM